MSQKFIVTAVDRRAQGHPNCWRAGRSWPSGQEVEIEVLDQDDDPMVTEIIKGEKRTFPHPTQIGRASWASIQADKRLMKQPVGATLDQALSMQAQIDDLSAKLKTVTARADLAEQAGLERGAQLESTQAHLQVANERAESAEQAAAKLTAERDNLQALFDQVVAERDELTKQLEQLTAPAQGETAPPTPATKPQGKAKVKSGG